MKVQTLTMMALATSGVAHLSFAAPAVTPRLPAKPSLSNLFSAAATAFWNVEPKFHIYDNPIDSLSALTKGDPAIHAYRRAAQAAELFLASQQKPSEGTPVMLYFAAMSYSRLNEHEKTLLYIDRLLNEFPNYKRPRVDGDPFFDHPLRADLMHLRLWHSLQLNKKPETLESLKEMAYSASEIEKLREENNRIFQNKMPDLDRVAPTADMLRTKALPSALKLVVDANNNALPIIAKQKGAKAVRDYLRSLNQKPFAAYFADYAGKKLIDLDRVILASYRSEAEKAMRENRFAAAVKVYKQMLEDYAGSPVADEAATGLRKATIGGYRFAAQEAMKVNNFDVAKASWRKIAVDFAGSPEATDANAELKKLVPVAVKFYKIEGDKNYRPDDPQQFFKPQTKSREFYEKMYNEDPEGPQADYALLHWGQGLGTEGKTKEAIAKYDLFLKKFQSSSLIPDVMFEKAFVLGSNSVRKYDEAINLMMNLVKKYPKSEKAPFALWCCAFWRSRGQHRFTEAKQYLELLRAYPESSYAKNIEEELSKYEYFIKEGFGT